MRLWGELPCLTARLRDLDRAETAPLLSAVDHDAEDAEIVVLIESLIAERLCPYIKGDEGKITLVSFRDGAARVALRRASSGCRSSVGTLCAGVERLLCHYVPEVRRFEQA